MSTTPPAAPATSVTIGQQATTPQNRGSLRLKTINLTEDLNIGNSLDVTGTSTLNTLDVNGATSLQSVNVGQSLTVVGDLTVQGTTTTIESSKLEVQDPIVDVGSGSDE